MRILMVNKFLYPRAGAETYMLELSRMLINEGHEVAFFGMDHPDKTTLGPCYTIEPVEFGVDKGFFYKVSQLWKTFRQNLSIKKKFRGVCKSFEPDLIHAHNVYNQLPPSLFRGIKIPVIMTAHDYKPVCPSYNLFSKGKNCEKCLSKSFLPCVTNKCVQNSFVYSTIAALTSQWHKLKGTYKYDFDRYIAPSHFMKNKLIAGEIPQHKIEVIHNFNESDQPYTKPGTNLLYAGRICQEKGVDTLIEAYEKLPEPRPLLKICGTGPLKKQLQKISEENKLNIEWLGFVSPDTIKNEMKDAAAVIVPSLWYENCSMTIVESLNACRPVITSRSGGNSELINDSYNGFTFEAGNSDKLSQAITKLLSSDMVNLSLNSGYCAQKFYSAHIHVSAILKTYQKLCPQRLGSPYRNWLNFLQTTSIAKNKLN